MKQLLISILLLVLFGNSSMAQIQDNFQKPTANKIIESGKEFYLYKVQKSEGFYSIEKKFGVSRVEMVEFNPQIAQGLKEGQVIKIPIVQGRNSTFDELKESEDFIYHTVEKGQNLFFISRKYDVTVEDILRYNPGSREIVIVGTELKIPRKKEISLTNDNSKYMIHTVQPGETLSSISRKYGKKVMALVEANPGLETDQISVGAQIRIPAASSLFDAPMVKENVEDSTAFVFEDETYFYHKIKPKQTFYAIVNQYNVDEEAVLKVNNISNPSNLKVGYIIKIPKAAIKKVQAKERELIDKSHLIYKVADRREMAEDIARKFNVSVQELMDANDDFPRKGRFKRDDLVHIPLKNVFVKQIRDHKERPQLIRDFAYERDSILLREAFIAGCDTQLYDRTIKLAILWPFYLQANDTCNLVYEYTPDGDTIVKQRNPLEVYPNSDRNGFREFYQGAMVAIDSLKRLGIRLNIHTYDTAGDTIELKKVLSKPELKEMDIILGPVYSENAKLASEFCLKHQIKLVLPYTVSQSITHDNPYLFQVNPFKTVHDEPTIDFIVKNYSRSNIILVYNGQKTQNITRYISSLKRQLIQAGMNQFQAVSIKEVDVKKYGFQGLEKVIDMDKHNLVVLPPEETKVKRYEIFNLVVPTIENMVEKKHLKNITLFAYPDCQTFTSSELRMVFKSNTVLYTPFYVDFNAPITDAVIKLYRHKFNSDPSADYPYYGFLGFDIVYYFIHAIHEFGPDFERCLPYLNLDLTTSGFNFQRVNNWSGFVNSNVVFLNYDRDYNIKKQNYIPQSKPSVTYQISTNN